MVPHQSSGDGADRSSQKRVVSCDHASAGCACVSQASRIRAANAEQQLAGSQQDGSYKSSAKHLHTCCSNSQDAAGDGGPPNHSSTTHTAVAAVAPGGQFHSVWVSNLSAGVRAVQTWCRQPDNQSGAGRPAAQPQQVGSTHHAATAWHLCQCQSMIVMLQQHSSVQCC